MIFKLNTAQEPKVCCYELWDNKAKKMKCCGNAAAFQVGRKYVCNEHAAQAGYRKMELREIKGA